MLPLHTEKIFQVKCGFADFLGMDYYELALYSQNVKQREKHIV
jgi:hypothetical protein